jgi:hypothetical protein
VGGRRDGGRGTEDMSEYEARTTTLSEEEAEVAQRLTAIEKRLTAMRYAGIWNQEREFPVRALKRWFLVVALTLEALEEEVRRMEAEKPITGR